MKKIILLLTIPLLLFSLLILVNPLYALEDCPHTEIDKCIDYYQEKVNQVKDQGKTLSSQISAIDSQVRVTELRISATEREISELTLDIDTTEKKIGKLDDSLDNLTKVLIGRIRATYQEGRIQPFYILLSSNDATNFFTKLNYLRIARDHDRRVIYDTVQAKNDYTNQKEILEGKKLKVVSLEKQLTAYNTQLQGEKSSKQILLAATRNDEARYQRLLEQARAERAIVFGGGTDVYIRDVNQGDSIGSIASHSVSPGCSTGAHLHFEVQKNGSIQNPDSYLGSANFSYSYGSDEYDDYGTVNPSGSFPWPLNEPIVIHQGYGSHTFAKQFYSGGTHTGIDTDSSSSTVKAVEAGKLHGGSYNCTNGKLYYAKVVHDDGLTTWYLHMVPN